MKKILSAVFVMTMLVITATFASSVLAADPYQYTPDDGLPVVYVSKTGDVNSSVETPNGKEYTTLNAAVGALKEKGGYVILLEDVEDTVNDVDDPSTGPSSDASANEKLTGTNGGRSYTFPTTSGKKVIIRGRDDLAEFPKIYLRYMCSIASNSEYAFENVHLYWRKYHKDDNDQSLQCGTSKVTFGIKGNPNSIKVTGMETLTGSKITINGGTFSIRMAKYGANADVSDVDIVLNGGTLKGITGAHSGPSDKIYGTNCKGDFCITVNGGTYKPSGLGFGQPNNNKFIVGGDYKLTINGGSVTAGTITPVISGKMPKEYKIGGNTIVNILGYTGDKAALASKFKAADWGLIMANEVYVSDAGDDANNGNKATPVATLARAHELITAGTTETQKYSGKIVISGSGFTVDKVIEEPAHSAPITYNCDGDAALKFESGKFVLGGDVEFKNFNFVNTNSDTAVIEAAGHSLTIADSVKCTAAEGTCIDIIGGKETGTVDSVNVTVNGGEFASIKAGDSVTGNVDITVNGGVICGDIVGGSSVNGGVIGGNTKVVINDGTIEGQVIGGNEAAGATVKGTAYIEVNGGKFVKDAALIATNTNAEAEVTGNAEIKINAGDFTGMNARNVNAGIGTCGDKICLDYKNYTGDVAALEAAISAASFNVVVERRADKPVFTEADKFIYIIASYGDPTKALTKSVPFKITQSAAQTAAPIVVSPKQLNLKVNGGDHANLSLQTVKDTGDTIRIIPNHNPTKGSRIVVDGYNINGRGVDVTKYKYIEIVYYYTVPEGDTPAVSNMAINYLGDFSKISGTSGTLVPNKWTTTIIDLTGVGEGITGNLKQYHFSPMGLNKKGTDVPANQYLDIMSMTFYTDKPQTTIQGGNAPGAKIVEPEEKPVIVAPTKPAGIEDIVVNVVNLKSTVDNSGAFTAAQVSKDGMTVMEYTPNLESAKELSIEGYNCMGKLISLNDYQYLTMKILVETKRTDVTFKPQITNCNGGVADNPEKAKQVTWTSETALVPNEWTTVTLKIAPADPAFHITRQFHIAPIGMIKGNTMKEGEKFYLAEFVLSNKPPKAPAAADGEEVVEVEQEVIEEAPAVVVEGAKLLNSAGDFATFKSTVGEFDGKQVVRISANKVDAPVAIDGSAIFGNTEQTPDGALSLKKHRYAVITYYYDTADANAERIPEFTLLGGRIQNKGNTVNGVVAKGTTALKKNEWATVVVKLSGNGKGELTSGFTLRPFGNVSANSIPYGDVLYIENITFVSNLPQ